MAVVVACLSSVNIETRSWAAAAAAAIRVIFSIIIFQKKKKKTNGDALVWK